MDRVTESIAHFIGAFELAEESGRLRAQYDKIAAQRPPGEDLGGLAFKGLHLKPEHPLEDLDPQIAYQPLPPTPFWILAMPPRPADAPPLEIAVVTPSPTLPDAPRSGSDEVVPSLVLPHELPPPSSVAAMLHMINELNDADWFGELDCTLVAQMSGLPQLMHILTNQVLALSPLEAPLPLLAEGASGAFDWTMLTPAIAEAAGQLAGGALDATVLQGPETLGLHIDGAAVEALSDWQALWPEFLTEEAEAQDREQPEDNPEEGGTASGGDEEGQTSDNVPDFATGWDRALEGLGEASRTLSGTAEPEGPFVVTGANKLINEVAITSDWLDAPVIVVEGDAHSFDALSQVNMVFDRDQSVLAQDAPSLAQNAASITVTADPKADDMPAGQQPTGWAVARITGDLVQTNGVQQYNFANDSDVARIELGSDGLHLGLGENQLDNLAVLNQFGWVFDMIIVGGQMIDVNMIRQVNLLVDDDSSTAAATGPKGGEVGDLHLSMSGSAQPGKAQAKESVSETVQLSSPTGKTTTELVAEPAKAPPPENLAYNEARIQTEGQDLAVKLPAALAKASAALVKGAETIEQEVLGLDLFEGVELLKVLLIEGDLTTINWIDQINVLGDSDRVELLQEAIAALPGAQLVTGSNLLANIATIIDRGVDTQLMAKGEIYNDALLHQAGLVEDGTPTGAAGPAALASEAVAFLAEGMIEAGMADLEVAQAQAQAELAAMSASQIDLMQTMLS